MPTAFTFAHSAKSTTFAHTPRSAAFADPPGSVTPFLWWFLTNISDVRQHHCWRKWWQWWWHGFTWCGWWQVDCGLPWRIGQCITFALPFPFPDLFPFQGQLFDEKGLYKYGHPSPRQADDWYPYRDHTQFETADIFFHQIQLSTSEIDSIMQLWSATVDDSPTPSPFKNHCDMYKTINQTSLGDIPWSSFTLQYDGEKPTDNILEWMNATYQICYCYLHGMLSNPEFKDHLDYVPYCKYDPKTQQHQWQDFMSGDWAWMQAVCDIFSDISSQLNRWQDEIAKDPSTHGSMFVSVILGGDKTVVSVATGHTEYWPLYLSTGNVWNHLHQVHKGVVTVIGFLSISKSESTYHIIMLCAKCTTQQRGSTHLPMNFAGSNTSFFMLCWPRFYCCCVQQWPSLNSCNLAMVITVVSFMALGLTLLTMRNKSS